MGTQWTVQTGEEWGRAQGSASQCGCSVETMGSDSGLVCPALPTPPQKRELVPVILGPKTPCASQHLACQFLLTSLVGAKDPASHPHSPGSPCPLPSPAVWISDCRCSPHTPSWLPVVRFIEEQFEQYLRDESGLNRKNIQDSRVHCCLYFISPFGRGSVGHPRGLEHLGRAGGGGCGSLYPETEP